MRMVYLYFRSHRSNSNISCRALLSQPVYLASTKCLTWVDIFREAAYLSQELREQRKPPLRIILCRKPAGKKGVYFILLLKNRQISSSGIWNPWELSFAL